MVVEDEAVLQIVDRTFVLPTADLTGVAPEDRAAQVEALRQREAVRRFDLERGPLLRASLLRLGTDERGRPEHILLLTLHHIAADGWSLDVLTRDVAALYEAFAQNRPSPLPPLPRLHRLLLRRRARQ